MKRFLSVIACAFLMLGLSGIAWGAKTTKTPKNAGSGYDGTIRRVTRATIILEIGTADAPKEVTIVLARNTSYTAEGKTITQADLAEGQHVSISVVENVAKKVDVKNTEKTDEPKKPK